MARIPYFEPATATGRLAETYAKLPPLNVFRMMGHGGGLLTGFVALGNQLLVHGELDPVLREIAIVRVGLLCGSAYEVQQHEAISRKLGMSDALIAGVREGPEAPAFDDLQRLVMAFTDDVVQNVRASDATFEPLRERLSTKALAELTICIGYYMMVSRFLETFDVDLEAERDAGGLALPGMAG
jgi:4-carboxymuconolactone decarboxylase